MNQNETEMFIVHEKRGGKPQIVSDNNRTKNGMLNQNLSREGWRIATAEEIAAYYPEMKTKPKAAKPTSSKKDEKKEEEK